MPEMFELDFNIWQVMSDLATVTVIEYRLKKVTDINLCILKYKFSFIFIFYSYW